MNSDLQQSRVGIRFKMNEHALSYTIWISGNGPNGSWFATHL